MKPITEIIKEFEKIMPKTSTEGISYGHFCAIRDFVTNTIKERDEAIREMIEGMRKYAETQISSSDYVNIQNHLLGQYITGYNKALEDLLEKLNK